MKHRARPLSPVPLSAAVAPARPVKTWTVSISIVVASLTSAPVFADSGAYDFVHCYSGSPQTIRHADGAVVNAVLVRGTVRASSPGQMFDNMSTQCVGIFGQLSGSTFSQGYCEFFDSDSDRILIRYERTGNDGTMRSVSAMGKYQGVSLDGTYSTRIFPASPGVVQGCAQTQGRWERR
jgi:hypothetical protein